MLTELCHANKGRAELRAISPAQVRAALLQHVALDMKKLMGDQDHIRENLFAYI